MTTTVDRYRGRVEHFQIWNEPNLGTEWTGRVDPDAYAELLRIAYTRAKAANPNAVVLCAPLAINLERGPVNLNELEYLDQLYAAGAQPYFDIMLANAYGMDRPPTEPPRTDTLNFQRVRLLRDVMVRHNDGEKAVWFNEYGWNASPPTMPPEQLIWRRVTEQQQAEWTVEGGAPCAARVALGWLDHDLVLPAGRRHQSGAVRILLPHGRAGLRTAPGVLRSQAGGHGPPRLVTRLGRHNSLGFKVVQTWWGNVAGIPG